MRLLAQPDTPADSFDPTRPWIDLGLELCGETRLFRQYRVLRRSPHSGREHAFTRLACPEWVNVVAFTRDGELLLVQQFRHGLDAATLEIIGGVVDPGEAPAETARRELREETGFEAASWESLGSVSPNPAIQDNRVHFFLALDCEPKGPLDLDPSEEIRVWAAPWAEALDLLRRGAIDHALVLAAFHRLFLWPGWPALEARLLKG